MSETLSDGAALRFRAARPCDVDALVAHVNAGYRGAAARVGWTHEADLIGDVRVTRDMMAAMVAATAEAFDGGAGASRVELAYFEGGCDGGCDEHDGKCGGGPGSGGGGGGGGAVVIGDAVAAGARFVGCVHLRMAPCGGGGGSEVTNRVSGGGDCHLGMLTVWRVAPFVVILA